MNTPMSKIYTDGSCLSNPGIGGWAFIIIENEDIEVIGYNSENNTTNNRMELEAVIQALTYLEKNECKLYTDSQWVLNCAIGKWKRKANLDLWEKYNKISKNIKINWEWVKAHNGDKYNELVDNFARSEAKNYEKNLKILPYNKLK